jgi:hypothetical protein
MGAGDVEDSGSSGAAARLGDGAADRADQQRVLAVNPATLYPVPLKLEQEGAIASAGELRKRIAGRVSIG